MRVGSWSPSSRERWGAAFAGRYLPLSQTWEWGEAKRSVGHHVERLMVGEDLGVQFESRRGVAWAPAAPAGEIDDPCDEALRELSKEIRRPILLSPVRPVPGLGGPIAVGMFHSGTVLFDLAGDESDVHSRLRKTWRNGLSRGQRGGAEITDGSASELLAMLEELADRKGFEIPYDAPFVAALQLAFGEGFALRIARHQGRAVAGRLDLRNGATATSFISATTVEGRSVGASYLLTWDAVLRHRQAGAIVYDLGGISSERSSGTTVHKLSMGGEVVDYPGTYLIGDGPRSYAVRAWLRLKHLRIRGHRRAEEAPSNATGR
jgi:hypothetical protein